ncbi:hypothetical protein NKH30_23500 [Mesorhizobium sp. M1273]
MVVGIIIDADKQLMRAEAAVNEALESVPTDLRKGFVYSAKDVWNNPDYWEKWSRSNRLAFLKSMMSLPRRLKAPITLSIVRRGLIKEPLSEPPMQPHQFEHFMAFATCIARADKHIRDHGQIDEVGTVVAEQASEMTKFLRAGALFHRQFPRVIPPSDLSPTEEETKLGYIKQETELRVSRIRATIHFVEKSDDKLILLADSVAYGFRRFFNRAEFGDQFVRSIIGNDLSEKDWEGSINATTFNWI